MSQNKFGYYLSQKFFLEVNGVVFWFESFPAMTTFQSAIGGFPKLIFQTTGTFFLSPVHARILAFAGSLFRLYPYLFVMFDPTQTQSNLQIANLFFAHSF